MRIEREHLLPLAERRLRAGRDELSDGGRQGLCEGADQLVLDAAEAGNALPGAAAAGLRGDLARAGDAWRGTSATSAAMQQVLDLEHYLDVLRTEAGALAGSRPLQQWRRARSLAGELRPAVAELGATAGASGGHAGDDRVAAARASSRAGTS